MSLHTVVPGQNCGDVLEPAEIVLRALENCEHLLVAVASVELSLGHGEGFFGREELRRPVARFLWRVLALLVQPVQLAFELADGVFEASPVIGGGVDFIGAFIALLEGELRNCCSRVCVAASTLCTCTTYLPLLSCGELSLQGET